MIVFQRFGTAHMGAGIGTFDVSMRSYATPPATFMLASNFADRRASADIADRRPTVTIRDRRPSPEIDQP